MGDGLESRIAVLEAVMPRVETMLASHINETRNSRQTTNEKIDHIAEALAARENQAKGAVWLWEFLRSSAVFLAGAGALKWFGFLR